MHDKCLIDAEISTMVCLYLKTATLQEQKLCLYILATKQNRAQEDDLCSSPHILAKPKTSL